MAEGEAEEGVAEVDRAVPSLAAGVALREHPAALTVAMA